MSREDEPMFSGFHLEAVYRSVLEEDAVVLGRQILMEYATRFAGESYRLLGRFALPEYRGEDETLTIGTVTTRQVPFPTHERVVRVRIQADLSKAGWEEWGRSWRNLGLHFEDDTSTSALLIPDIGWNGDKPVPTLDQNSPRSFIDFKNGIDILSSLERKLSRAS